MQEPFGEKHVLKLSIVFALIYFFSTNGLASLPGITVGFLLKDVLKMTAEQAAYFGAITTAGWAVKPLWGILSDSFPIFGYRRKSYLIATSLGAALIWFVLGQIQHYDTATLIILFVLSSAAYAFMDVLCDALMVETGKPLNLTGRLQSVQWTSVYVASIVAGLAGGWVAEHLAPQSVFSINALFPLIILAAVLAFVRETKIAPAQEQFKKSVAALKEAFRHRTLWLLAFFLFFWTFSPSFGAPFFYYAVDTLKFDKVFFGIAAAIGAATSAVGAIFYGIFSKRLKTRTLVRLAVIVGVVFTLFDLIYFLPAVQGNPLLARILYLSAAGILGAIGAVTFLVMLNTAALACPKYSEGTTFAVLTSFWNVGLIGSGALGGYLFSKIGLQPLIVVSALFTAATWIIVPYLKFADEK